MTKPLDVISEFYLDSHRFNGYPFAQLQEELGLSFDDAFEFVKEQVLNGNITIIFGDIHPNPHIKAFSDEPKETVIEKLDKNKNTLSGDHHTCLYPTKLHLETIVNPDDYRDRPYTLEMALGAGQLEFRFFDLVVLEFYRNDPRYYYRCDDINGHISIHDEHYHDDSMNEADKILLETFGFAYDEAKHRAVTTFVYYISMLSPEHQQVWKMRELAPTGYCPHPDYYRNNIIGDWGEKIPICTAFVMELKVINQMCSAMGKPPLFHKDFGGEERPQGFSFLVRPTHKEYYDFVGLLDKMISDNINKKFFEDDISLEKEETRPDGKIQVVPKGTIQVLEEWIGKYFHPQDREPINNMFSAFRRVRKERQRPAHAIDDNRFDQQYFADQRQILKDAYSAIRMLRLILANHPAVKLSKIKIPEVLFKGKIWTI